MGAPLTAQAAVEAALLRPLTDTEAGYLTYLIARASSQLRAKLPAIDERIAKFEADPTDPAGIDPVVVAGMLGEVIKRVMINPKGLWSTSTGTGPFSHSETFRGSRSGNSDSLGGLAITDEDIDSILPPLVTDGYVPALTIRTRPVHLLGPIGPRWGIGPYL